MEPIKVAVNGALGKMGGQILSSLSRYPELEPVGGVDIKAEEDRLALSYGPGLIPLSTDLEAIIQHTHPQVVVDFSNAEGVLALARTATSHKVHLVIGTSGVTPDQLQELDQVSRANGVGCVVAPNFALGAVLMIHLAQIAGRFFDYADIIELHHEQKVDAPSGTALATARAMVQARGGPFKYEPTQQQNWPQTRGGELQGIGLHSVRLPGLVAHQEVIFGGLGQTLSIRHDSVSRDSFIPGVVLAIKEVVKRQGLIYGLDKLLNL